MRNRRVGLLALIVLINIAVLIYIRINRRVDWSTRDEIPPHELTSVMEAHYRGLGAMERYEYAQAAEAFGEVHRKAPGWIAGSINLAIALLNQGGEAEAKAKFAGRITGSTDAPKKNIDEAARLLTEVIARQPDNPWAYFSRGIIYQDQGLFAEANRDFEKVTQIDPGDANAWLEYGSTLDSSMREDPDARRDRAKKQASLFAKALECNPYLTTATYKLSSAHRDSGDFESMKKLLGDFARLNPDRNPAGSGEIAKLVYGEMGRYARVIDPFSKAKAPEKVAPTPRFDRPSEILVALPDKHRWAKASDFTGPLEVIGRARAPVRPGSGDLRRR